MVNNEKNDVSLGNNNNANNEIKIIIKIIW